jgi:dTDP-4-amino-4,6-dideoxygalactose transaminase
LLKSLVTPLNDGEKIQEAETAFARYINRRDCVVFPFARTAIWAVLKSLDLPPGSRIILPPITIKPILDVVVHLGYEPVFVDLDEDTACFDEDLLRTATEAGASVAILTYLFGLVPNVQEIVNILKSQHVFVIEDFSQCLNGEFDGKRIGTFGDVSVYSASSVKTFDTFGGGFCVFDDVTFGEELRKRRDGMNAPKRSFLIRSMVRNLVRNVASSRIVFASLTYWLIQLAGKFADGTVGRFTGSRDTKPLTELPSVWFHRYTSFQAEIAIGELPRVADKDRRRIRHVHEIDSLAPNSRRIRGELDQRHVNWQLIVVVEDFDRARRHFSRSRIDCATTSLVLLTDLPEYPGQRPTPVARAIYERGVYLPCFHQIRRDESIRIGNALRSLG